MDDKKDKDGGVKEKAKEEVSKRKYYSCYGEDCMEYDYSPHIFSDENPNACSLM